MSALFGRIVNVVVGPRAPDDSPPDIESKAFDLSNLDCVFHAKKSLKQEPNTCEVKLYNLAEFTRLTLETPKRLILRLDAGYPGKVCQIFLGEVRGAKSSVEGPDIITEISTGDSEQEMATSRIKMTVGPNTTAKTVLEAIAREMKVGLGNVSSVAARLQASGAFGQGTLIKGKCADELTRVCDANNISWSVQNGVLQFLEHGTALDAEAVLLSPNTGLVGSPTIDHKGIVSATALIQPDLTPGRKVKFDSLAFKGVHKITDVEYTGDTRGQDWYAKIHAGPV